MQGTGGVLVFCEESTQHSAVSIEPDKPQSELTQSEPFQPPSRCIVDPGQGLALTAE